MRLNANAGIDRLPRATLQISARSSAPGAILRNASAVPSKLSSITIVPLTFLLPEPRASRRAVPHTRRVGAA
jgi:hypothetical protein